MPTKPLAYVFPYAWLFWAVFLLVYVPEFRLIARARPEPGQAPDRSMGVILLLGWIGFHVIGAYIHILLVIALVVLILGLIQGRRTL